MKNLDQKKQQEKHWKEAYRMAFTENRIKDVIEEVKNTHEHDPRHIAFKQVRNLYYTCKESVDMVLKDAPEGKAERLHYFQTKGALIATESHETMKQFLEHKLKDKAEKVALNQGYYNKQVEYHRATHEYQKQCKTLNETRESNKEKDDERER